MKGFWWKALCMLLLLYVVVAGMLVPLKPGISSVTPRVVDAGESVELTVTGYNTHLLSGGEVRAWLRIGRPSVTASRDTAIGASAVRVMDEQTAILRFDVPRYLPSPRGRATATLVMDSPRDGAYVLPAAVEVMQPADLVGPPDPGAWNASLSGLHASSGLTYPYRGLLGETIRNQYFHVSLWFALMILMLVAAVYAVRYLVGGNAEYDRRSEALTRVGLGFGVLGLLTGMLWANYTWGKPWSGDIKQEMTAIALLIYAAYFVLRGSLHSSQQAARVGSAYNVFAFAMLIPLLYIIPRVTDSLHPGAGGNPGFGGEDLDNTMRMVFYPGIIGLTLLGLWIAQLWWRTRRLEAFEEVQLARAGRS